MILFHRKALPARQPHPDPVTEGKLQRIVSLRAAIVRQEAAAAEHLEELRSARREQEKAGKNLSVPGLPRTEHRDAYDAMAKNAAGRAVAAQSRLGETEKDIAALHDEIAKRSAEMDPSDLAWL
jgi:hypothetical protein